MVADNPIVSATRARIPILLDGLSCARQTRILDVGANPINEPPYKLLLDAGACHIWGFDPHPGAFRALEEAKGEHETYFQLAVGAGRTETLNIYRGSGYTSIYKLREATKRLFGPEGGMTQLRVEQSLDTVTLDSIAELPRPDLLKIDIQGGELDVIANGRDKLSEAVCIIIEMPFLQLYDGAPHFGTVDLELRNQGFVLHRFHSLGAKVMHSSQSDRLRAHTPYTKTQLIDGDAVYLRDISCPEKMSDEQIRHLVLLADSVFNSNDLALRMIDELVRRNAAAADLAERYLEALPPQIRL